MGRFSRLGTELYDGRKSIDFVGRRWTWYAISGVLILVALTGLFAKGLNLGIEFKGGVEYTVSVPASERNQQGVDKIRDIVTGTGIAAAESPIVNTSGEHIKVTTETMSNDDADKITAALRSELKLPASGVSSSEVGASWGHEVANRQRDEDGDHQRDGHGHVALQAVAGLVEDVPQLHPRPLSAGSRRRRGTGRGPRARRPAR
jgi:preprotein translocase subunit SecF